MSALKNIIECLVKRAKNNQIACCEVKHWRSNNHEKSIKKTENNSQLSVKSLRIRLGSVSDPFFGIRLGSGSGSVFGSGHRRLRIRFGSVFWVAKSGPGIRSGSALFCNGCVNLRSRVHLRLGNSVFSVREQRFWHFFGWDGNRPSEVRQRCLGRK